MSLLTQASCGAEAALNMHMRVKHVSFMLVGKSHWDMHDVHGCVRVSPVPAYLPAGAGRSRLGWQAMKATAQ